MLMNESDMDWQKQERLIGWSSGGGATLKIQKGIIGFSFMVCYTTYLEDVTDTFCSLWCLVVLLCTLLDDTDARGRG